MHLRCDRERRHDFEAAQAEYDRLREAYPQLGYEVAVLPKAGVDERADFVLAMLVKERPAVNER